MAKRKSKLIIDPSMVNRTPDLQPRKVKGGIVPMSTKTRSTVEAFKILREASANDQRKSQIPRIGLAELEVD